VPDRADAGQDVASGACAVDGWQACWATCTGPSHVRRGVAREDAVTATGRDGVLAVAVSDGHGMARAFRAHVGSQLAADVAVAEALTARQRWGGPVSDIDAATWLAEEFTNVVLHKWRALVRQHRDANPFTEAELASAGYGSGELDIGDGEDRIGPAGQDGAALQLADDDALVAYGTTLLVAMAAGRRVLAWQLGDGDLVAAIGGRPTGPVVPVDPTLFGNRTTSLCLPGAEQQARSGALYLDAEPVLLVIATDGFGNAMVADDWQQQLGSDLHERLSSGPFDDTAQRIPSWAQEAAIASGDDVTVALLVGGYGRAATRPGAPMAPISSEGPSVGGEPAPAMPGTGVAQPSPPLARATPATTLVQPRPDQFEPAAVKSRGWWRRGGLLALGATLVVIAAGLVALYIARADQNHRPTKPTKSHATKSPPVPRSGTPSGSATAISTAPDAGKPSTATAAQQTLIGTTAPRS
jgi:hypothetical protein